MRPLPKEVADLSAIDAEIDVDALTPAERQHCIRRVTRRMRERLAKMVSDFHSRNLDRSRIGRGVA